MSGFAAPAAHVKHERPLGGAQGLCLETHQCRAHSCRSYSATSRHALTEKRNRFGSGFVIMLGEM